MNLKETPSETLDSMIVESLTAASTAEKQGDKESAATHRQHASELTKEIIDRRWIRGASMRETLQSRGAQPTPVPDHEFRATVNWYCHCGK